MAPATVIILLSALISQLIIYPGSLALETTSGDGESSQQQQQQQQEPRQQQVESLGSISMTGGRPISLYSAPIIKRLVKSEDEDHSNIDLNKLQEANRYIIIPDTIRLSTTTSTGRLGSDPYNLVRLFSRILNASNKNNNNIKNQYEWKRNGREFMKEDKDYSFVGLPTNVVDKYSSANRQQLVFNNWMAQKLRNLANEQNSRIIPQIPFVDEEQNGNYLNDLPQVNYRSFNGAETNTIPMSENEVVPKIREKRRRCKMDPNLGVKNPSFCDTDAYFGAADYSMRDVWDSAGR